MNNRFGLNCFACHVRARTEFAFVCEVDHGCDAIPVTRAMFSALQNTGPRYKGSETVSAEDQASLKQLDTIVKSLTKKEKA